MSDPVQTALERHRDDDPPRLDFSVPVDRLIDVDHCKALSADIALAAPDGWEVVKATKTAWRAIPSDPGVYMFVWNPSLELKIAASGRPTSFPFVLYVGKAGDGNNTSTLRSRYRGEYSRFVAADPELLWEKTQAQTREDRLRRFLTLTPLQFWYCSINKGHLIAEIERRIFSLLSPPLNSAGTRRLRPVGKSRPAF